MKVDNASQSIYNPFTSGTPQSPAATAVRHRRMVPVRQWHTDLDTVGPRVMRVMKKIEPSKSVKK